MPEETNTRMLVESMVARSNSPKSTMPDIVKMESSVRERWVRQVRDSLFSNHWRDETPSAASNEVVWYFGDDVC